MNKYEFGQCLKRINRSAIVDPQFPVRSGVTNRDVLRSYRGFSSPTLCQRLWL